MGLKLWFWSHDHLPPHFHAKRSGKWEVKVFFLRRPGQMAEVVWADRRPDAKTLDELLRLAERRRDELRAQWEEVHPDAVE